MKCIKKDDKVMKVPETVAAEKVKQGWSYCPRSEFKTSNNKETIHKPKEEISDRPRKKRSKKSEDTEDSVDKAINKKN